MVKKVVVILTVIFVFALWRGVTAQKPPGASQPGRVAARGTKQIDYSKFQHSTHAGLVGGALKKSDSQELKCDYCHQTPTKEQPEVTGYPNEKPGVKVTHSACIDCHLMAGRPEYPAMCLICHSTSAIGEMKKNIREFPNLKSGPNSQFSDYYSHSEHSGYFDASAAFKERFKDKTKFKEKDNFECAACHESNLQPVAVGGIQFAKGIKERAPGHTECFVCHFNEKEVAKKAKSFATNCVGCHNLTKKEKGPGSELAVLWFAREIVNTELNPAKPPQKPGGKPSVPAPFNHKAHETDYDDSKEKRFGQGTQSCLICHETGKTANRRSDFFNENRKTMTKQPSAPSCIACHKSEMQKKIGGAVTLENAKCNECHALQTLKDRAAKGVALPPPSHFGKPGPEAPATIAAATAPPKPATGTTVTPPKPTPAPTPKPTPTPTPTSAPKPTTAPTSAPKPTPTPTPTPAPKPAATTAATTTPAPTSAPTPTPPKPTPAPDPAPAAATTTPAASANRKPEPTGIVRLGDPKESSEWGQHAKWGVVENFNHGDHTKPKYSERCEDCHHTNKNAKVEEVLKCLTCHKGPDNPDTASKGGGVSVEDAYHGVPDSPKAPKAGCIECHKRYRDKDPSSKAPIKSPCSGCHTEKTARLDPRLMRPERDDWVKANLVALTGWLRNSRAGAPR
jgi:hypothetical protein